MLVLSSIVADNFIEVLNNVKYTFDDFFMDTFPYIVTFISSYICGILHIKSGKRNNNIIQKIINYIVGTTCLFISICVLYLYIFFKQNPQLLWITSGIIIILGIIKTIIDNIKCQKDRKRYEETYGRKL